MKNKDWWTNERVVDEYGLPNDRCKITIEEYSDKKGVFFTIEYSMYDDFGNKIYNKIVDKSRREDATRRLFKNYIDLLETMADSMLTYKKTYGDD